VPFVEATGDCPAAGWWGYRSLAEQQLLLNEGRDSRVAKYERHLQYLLTSTFHEPERLLADVFNASPFRHHSVCHLLIWSRQSITGGERQSIVTRERLLLQ